MPSKLQSPARQRPKMPRISEEMRRLAVLLGQELASWPEVSMRPMFGMEAYYRGNKIFAALPRTRAMGTRDSIAFKLPRGLPADGRLQSLELLGSVWKTFELSSASDLNDALRLLEMAYRQAK